MRKFKNLLPSLFLVTVACLLGLAPPLVVQAASNSLHCWSNECASNDPWCIQTCPEYSNTSHPSCLAQYRISFGEVVPSYFGCHSTPWCLAGDCVPTEGVSNDFSCCCTGDLCNSIQDLTPNGDQTVPIGPTNPYTPPPPAEDILLCEEYMCDDNGTDCYYGYQQCPYTNNTYCQANYEYNSTIGKYQLARKQCKVLDTNNQAFCETDTCDIHSDSPFDDHRVCCCSGHLCNQDVVFSNINFVDKFVDPCAELECGHSCIIHLGEPQCLCGSGSVLDEDGQTCVDLNECQFENGGCEILCVNEHKTGHHCGCPAHMKLDKDQTSCLETGLICHSIQCSRPQSDGGNITNPECSRKLFVNDYCDERGGENHDSSQDICQATYKLLSDGTFEPRLLSCFQGNYCVEENRCVLVPTVVQQNVYHCCCKKNYCNDNLVYPNISMTPLVPTPTMGPPTDEPMSQTSPTKTATPTDTTPQSPLSQERSKIIFIVVVIIAVLILVPVITAGIGCMCYMYSNSNPKLPQANTPREEEQLLRRSPDMIFQNLTFIDKVGQGRFAAVWRAKNVEAEVAVKVFPTSQMSRDSWSRECNIYNTPELEHKYILSFRGSLEKDGELWIVSDYYPLGSLHDLLKKQTLSLRQFCDLAESAAIGLAHLHDQRIVDGVTKKPSIAHRDLKSKNILISNNYTCVISDFGLAVKFVSEETTTDAHGQVGTSRYMAPEVLEGAISFHREAYLRIDVYAFALILWELASRTNLPNSTVKQYNPPFEEFVSSNPSIEEMREIVVSQFKRPTIAKGFATSGEYDSLRDTIEESWDQEPEARLSAQCIAERIRTFKQSKFGSKDSGLTNTNSPTDLTVSADSQLEPTPSPSSTPTSITMMHAKHCNLDSGTESYPGQAFSSETIRLGTTSSNSSFGGGYRSRGSMNFDPFHHQFLEAGLSRNGHAHYNGHTHHHASSNRAMYGLHSHSTETTV